MELDAQFACLQDCLSEHYITEKIGKTNSKSIQQISRDPQPVTNSAKVIYKAGLVFMGGSRIFDWGGLCIMKVRDDGQIAVTFALNSWPIETKKFEI